MTDRTHAEVERKYVVDESASLPLSLDDLALHVGETEDLDLEAEYFDTAGLDLLGRGITLRRRTGGDDAGWHVKVPRGPDRRTETGHPLGQAGEPVPRAVADPVRALLRDREPTPVAAIRTHRVQYTLVDASEDPVAVLCDDHVSARRLPDGPELTWREWEVELAEGQPASLLDRVEPMLLDAGASSSDYGSKLDRVLGREARDRARPTGRSWDAGASGAVVQRRLAEQVAALHEQDASVRAGGPEGVHQMRIAARRIRAALTTTKPMFEISQDDLREELRWLGQELSPARDTQVIHERLAAALADLPVEQVMGPVRARLDAELTAAKTLGMARAREALESTRYYRLLDALDDLLADLPLDASGVAPARRTLAALVRRDAKRMRRAVRAIDAQGPEGHDPALHEARKKAKRLRYAAELATPAGARRTKRLAKRAKGVQQALGEHQDTVVARARLRQLGAQAYLYGENGFTFGLLHGLERLRAEHAERAFEAKWSKVPSPATAEKWVLKR